MGPALSVGIPVYNGEAFIGDAVRSVLSQSRQDFELIVSDNASTDRTLEVLDALSDPRIRVLRSERNVGPAGNWNRLVEASGGRYLKILCADDVLAPDCLRRQADILDGDVRAEIAMVCSRRDIIDHEGRTLLRGRGLPGMRGRVPHGEAIARCVRSGGNPFGESGAVLVRTDTARAAGGFSDRLPYLMDVDFYCRVLRHGDLYALEDSLAAFRGHDAQASNAMVREQTAQTLALMRGLRRTDSAISTADWAVGAIRARMLPRARRMVSSGRLAKIAGAESSAFRLASRLL